MASLPLDYCNDPLSAVFLRILAWEKYVANKPLRVKDLVANQVQAARRELGLAEFVGAGGGAHDFIQDLRKEKQLTAQNELVKGEQWKEEWRLLNLPTHSSVRELSYEPVYERDTTQKAFVDCLSLDVTLRNPAVPRLKVLVGKGLPKDNIFENQRGIYFLRLVDSLYIGKSDEFDVRLSQHTTNKQPIWWVFVSLKDDEKTFTLDALGAAEALLISFWNEVSNVSNQNRGTERKPAFLYLQQAILLVMGASAVFVWLVRDGQKERESLGLERNWNIPFKRCKKQGWSEGYLNLPDNE